MADLSTSVRYIKGIGEKKAQAFGKLGVFSLYDLVSYFPSRYEDRTRFCPIAAAPEGEGVCIRALVADMPRLVRVRRGMELVKFRAVDESGSVDITYFNQNYIKDQLSRGDSVCFYGKIERNGSRFSMVNPAYEKEDKPRGVTGCILPVYRMNAALNQRTIRGAVRQGLDECGSELPDLLPAEIRARNGLAQARYAYENIHYPSDFDALAIARRRLVFEELFVLACALGTMRAERTRESGIPMLPRDFSAFYAALPFTPTGAQKRAIEEAARDMTGGFVMNRLVQGDVGSGKTLVAAALCWLCRENGFVSAFMAPTEILAEQHFATLSGLLAPFGMRIGRLTGAMSAKEKREAKAAIAAGEYDLVIGTHALFSEDVVYSRLGLIVTDEVLLSRTLEYCYVQVLGVQLEHIHQVFPCHVYGAFLEVVAEGPVAQHLEHGVVVGVMAYLLQVIVLAAYAQALLAVGTAARFGVAGSQDDVLPLVHTGIGEHQGRVVLHYHRGRGHNLMSLGLKEFLE